MPSQPGPGRRSPRVGRPGSLLVVAAVVATTAVGFVVPVGAAAVPLVAPVVAAPAEILADPCATPAPAAAGRARCYAVERERVVRDARTGRLTPTVGAPNPVGGITPAQVQKAYGATRLTPPTNATVGIVVAYDTPTVEADLAIFRAQYGLRPCTTANGCFGKVDQRGVTVPANKSTTSTVKPVYNAGWQLEATLDTQAVSAMCPTCKILLVEADDTSLTNSLGPAVVQAQTLGATVISNSFGGGESQDEVQADASYWSTLTVPVFAASGDAAHDDGFGAAHYPAVSPTVTAVGGTSATFANGALSGESVWLRQDSATHKYNGSGSGCSVVFRRPTWQAAYFTARAIDPYPYVTASQFGCNIPGQAVTPARAYSDLAAIADPYAPGFPLYLQGGWTVAGGTSLAVQLVAALAAYAGPRGDSTAVNAVAYGLAAASAPTGLVDVTVGSNRVPGRVDGCGVTPICNARTNWDGPTGLGTPRLLSVFAPLLALTPTTAVPGGTVTTTGSDFIPGETVTVTAVDGTVLATTTVRAAGTYKVSFTIPDTSTSTAVLRVTGGTSGFTASRTVTIAAPVLTVVPTVAPTTQVVPLEPVTVAVANFAALEDVEVSVTGAPYPLDLTADSTGAASGTVTVPPSASGSVTVQAVGARSGITLSRTLPVTANTVTPRNQTVPASSGATLTWSATGFGSGETITATDGPARTVVATTTAAADGTATFRWTLPADVTVAVHRLTVTGARTGLAPIVRVTLT